MIFLPLYISLAIIHYILIYMLRESMNFNPPFTLNNQPLGSWRNTQYQSTIVTNSLRLCVG